MTTTNMSEVASSHKGCDVSASRATLRRCELLQWAADQEKLSLHLHGVLIRLVKLMDDAGAIGIAQTEIAPLIGLGARQTRAAIKELVAAGKLKRTRRGTVGRGRAPDLLSANYDMGEVPPLSENSHKGDAAPLSPPPSANSQNDDIGGASPLPRENSDTGDNAATLPISEIEDAEFVDNSPAPYKGTGARADKLTFNTLSTEIYSEQSELVSESVREVVMAGGGPFREEWVLGTAERTFAHGQGLLNGNVDRTFAMFGAHHMAKGTITVNWRAEWKKWVLRQAHDPRFNASNQEKNHDQSSGAAIQQPSYPRAKRSRHIDALFGDEPDGSPIDLGRLDSCAVK